MTGYLVNKLDLEEVNYSPYLSNDQKCIHKEVTTNNQDISNDVVVDEKHLKFTGGKDIESETSAVKDETSDNEGDMDNNFCNLYGSLGE